MIEKQLCVKWLVPRAIDRLQVGNYPITCGSFKKKILIFGYDFPNITCDVVVHFTNIFYEYLVIVFASGTPNTF